MMKMLLHIVAKNENIIKEDKNNIRKYGFMIQFIVTLECGW